MHSVRRVARGAGLLAVLSLVAGVLVAGLALPVVAGVGWASHATNNALNKLPDALEEVPLAQHSVLLSSDGTPIATLAGAEDRVVVPLSSIPVVMQKSIVAIEDNRFYQHKGVDLRGVLRAARHDSTNGTTQGASTITQQYVKQALLELADNSNATPAEKKEAQKEATEKSVGRKLREARYAIALEKKLTKAQILERYLNIAYFGEGIYGVGTAAQHYFGVPVQKLTLAQSALLAGMVNSPSAFDPVAHPKAALDRRNLVLQAVQKYGFVPAAQVNVALRTPLQVHPTQKAVDSCATSTVPVFCRYALDQLLADKAFGATAAERQRTIFEGGLKIYTTLDLKTEQSLNAGLRANVQYGIRQVVATAAVEPGTGRVLGIAQNRDYGAGKGQSKYIYIDKHAWDTGSTFKIATLATALAAGLPISTSFNSPFCLRPVPGYPPGGRCPNGVTNAGDSEAGTYDMVSGTWYSVNTYFVQLEQKVGYLAVRDMAKNLGDLAPGLNDDSKLGYSLTLGSANGTSAIDLASMYATVAAHGTECDARYIDRITTLAGKPVNFTQAKACREAISPDVADTITSILQGVLTQPGATAAGKSIGRPAAGKTGTLDDYNGAWFAGYVPQLAVAVGIFDPLNPNSPATPITSVRTGRTYYSTLFGGDIPAQTWQTIMQQALQNVPVESFSRPQLGSSINSQAKPTTSPTPSTSVTPGTSPSTSSSTSPSGKPTKPAPTAKPGKSAEPPPAH